MRSESSVLIPDAGKILKSNISRTRGVLSLALAILPASIPLIVFESPPNGRIVAIATFCVLLWLLEIVPPFVPTLLLWALIPFALSSFDPKYSLANTLQWSADPVLALFFGGFVLAAATRRHGLDKKLALWAFARSGDSFTLILLTTMGLTAFMSMWISNIAAAALMFACLKPLLTKLDPGDPARRALLVGTAIGANLGGIATPIGTGPNAIAMSHLAKTNHITFVDWMTFAFPLTVGLLFAGFLFLLWEFRRASDNERLKLSLNYFFEDSIQDTPPSTSVERMGVLLVLGASVLLWLTEPFHGMPAAVVALSAAALLFLFGLLKKGDLARIDWSTLLLIAGGITIGRLLEASGLVSTATQQLAIANLHPTVALFLICLASAGLSAIMSNTATVVMLIPIAAAFIPQPSTAILIAVSASFGMPFAISTPPNAMAHGEGGLRSSDLLLPGLMIMLIGCALVSLTGRFALSLAGIP